MGRYLLAVAAGITILGWGSLHLASAQPVSGARPDCTLVISANVSGVLEPCGCQTAQAGGLARQAAAVQQLLREVRPAIFFDCGNLVSRKAPNAAILEEASAILQEIGYQAGTAGPGELGAGLSDREASGNAKGLSFGMANVQPRGGPHSQAPALLRAGRHTFELFSAVPPALTPSEYTWQEPALALKEAVARAAANGRIPVLVSFFPEAELTAFLHALPDVRLVFSRCTPGGAVDPKSISGRWVVPVPASGKELYQVGLSLDRGHIAGVKLNVVELPGRLAPDPKIEARIRAFYDLRRIGQVAGPSPLDSKAITAAKTFAGQAGRECGGCHQRQSERWSLTKHAHAWATLREKKATDRADCIGCHTTPLAVASLGSSMSGVGCQTCHGDGFRHAAQPRKAGLAVRIPAETACRECHTAETSPHFEFKPWLKRVSH